MNDAKSMFRAAVSRLNGVEEAVRRGDKEQALSDLRHARTQLRLGFVAAGLEPSWIDDVPPSNEPIQ